MEYQISPACAAMMDDALLRESELIQAPLRRVHPRGRLCRQLPAKGVQRVTYTRDTWRAVVQAARAGGAL